MSYKGSINYSCFYSFFISRSKILVFCRITSYRYRFDFFPPKKTCCSCNNSLLRFNQHIAATIVCKRLTNSSIDAIF